MKNHVTAAALDFAREIRKSGGPEEFADDSTISRQELAELMPSLLAALLFARDTQDIAADERRELDAAIEGLAKVERALNCCNADEGIEFATRLGDDLRRAIINARPSDKPFLRKALRKQKRVLAVMQSAFRRG